MNTITVRSNTSNDLGSGDETDHAERHCFDVVRVGVDGTPTSVRAAAHAAAVARASGAELELVAAVDDTIVQPAAVAVPMMAVDVGAVEGIIASADELLRCTANQIGTPHAGRRIEIGGAKAALISGTHEGSLVVVGNRRTHGATRVLGSVAAATIRAASCDVLVVDSTTDERREGVIVGVDRSPRALSAARRAADLALALDTWLHVVTCDEARGSRTVRVGSDSFHIDPIAAADDFLRDVRRRIGAERVTSSVDTGRPGRSLCRVAKDRGAGTVVVGNHRVNGAGRVLGSVAMDVLHHAPCDVFVANTTNR